MADYEPTPAEEMPRFKQDDFDVIEAEVRKEMAEKGY
jgi:hypothetical protein